MSGSSSIKINHLISSLAGCFGEIAWWPGYPDEVMIGAILTQQTRWENVGRALANLFDQNTLWVTHKLKLFMFRHIGDGFWSS